MKRLILVPTLFVLTLSGAYAAQKFTLTIPKGAENVRQYFDENGNEHASYFLAENKIVVASTRIVLRITSADRVSADTVSEDRQ